MPKSHYFASVLPLIRRPMGWKLAPLSYIFFFVTLLLSWGFLHFDVKDVWFAKLGLPLPIGGGLGEIKGTPLKLYVTEIYLLFCLLLALFNWKHWNPRAYLDSKYTLALLAFFAYGVFRLLLDLGNGPVLVIRSSAFVWYLSIPILISLSAIPSLVIESVCLSVLALGGIYFFGSILISIATLKISPYWIPFLGVYAFVFFALTSSKYKSLSYFLLFLLGVSFGIGYAIGFQRTNMLGIACLLPLAYAHAAKSGALPKVMIRTAVMIGLAAVIGVSLAHYLNRFKADSSFGANQVDNKKSAIKLDHSVTSGYSNPLQKSEVSADGLEVFRGQMWKDAAGLFLENPIIGIGFVKQVVYRVYLHSGIFLPNTAEGGKEMFSTPISGPHNSYLNSAARLGIPGIALLILHLWALIILYANGYWGAFFLVYAQIFYAMFNVGLEGPARSFYLLLGLSLAIRSSRPKHESELPQAKREH